MIIREIGLVPTLKVSIDKDESTVTVTTYNRDTGATISQSSSSATQDPAGSGRWKWQVAFTTPPTEGQNKYSTKFVGTDFGQERWIEWDWVSYPEKYNGIVHFDAINGEAGTSYPIGMSNRPCNNLANLKTIADKTENKIKMIMVHGALTLDRAMAGYIFVGANDVNTDSVALAGYDVSGSSFYELTMSGAMVTTTLPVYTNSCFFVNITNWHGTVENCAMNTNMSVKVGGYLNGSRFYGNSITGVSPILDLQSSATAVVGIADFSGLVEIRNLVNNGLVLIGGNALVTLHSSCTGGVYLQSGHKSGLSNGSAGTIVMDYRDAGYTEQSIIDGIVDLIKAQTDKMNFSGTDIKATLDGETVGLNDDAITSAKFDENTAFPVKSADAGATAIARTGADGDTLKSLSDQSDVITVHLVDVKGTGFIKDTDSLVNLSHGDIELVKQDIADALKLTPAVGSPASGSVYALLTLLQTDVTFIKDIEGGKWKIDHSTNQMIFYKSDNTTEVARFNLFQNGTATWLQPDERRRV